MCSKLSLHFICTYNLSFCTPAVGFMQEKRLGHLKGDLRCHFRECCLNIRKKWAYHSWEDKIGFWEKLMSHRNVISWYVHRLLTPEAVRQDHPLNDMTACGHLLPQRSKHGSSIKENEAAGVKLQAPIAFRHDHLLQPFENPGRVCAKNTMSLISNCQQHKLVKDWLKSSADTGFSRDCKSPKSNKWGAKIHLKHQMLLVTWSDFWGGRFEMGIVGPKLRESICARLRAKIQNKVWKLRLLWWSTIGPLPLWSEYKWHTHWETQTSLKCQ